MQARSFNSKSTSSIGDLNKTLQFRGPEHQSAHVSNLDWYFEFYIRCEKDNCRELELRHSINALKKDNRTSLKRASTCYIKKEMTSRKSFLFWLIVLSSRILFAQEVPLFEK